MLSAEVSCNLGNVGRAQTELGFVFLHLSAHHYKGSSSNVMALHRQHRPRISTGHSLRAPPAQMPRLEGPVAFLTQTAGAQQALAGCWAGMPGTLHHPDTGRRTDQADPMMTQHCSLIFNQNVESS